MLNKLNNFMDAAFGWLTDWWLEITKISDTPFGQMVDEKITMIVGVIVLVVVISFLTTGAGFGFASSISSYEEQKEANLPAIKRKNCDNCFYFDGTNCHMGKEPNKVDNPLKTKCSFFNSKY